ncbi:hypothetical protein RJT34_20549 [Clitoria ternatea]|uniref:Uncharacterized protein n=1 Tax=Clitoria ternatea TaxID=43366 RepID=A0AAN9P503_CLITE
MCIERPTKLNKVVHVLLSVKLHKAVDDEAVALECNREQGIYELLRILVRGCFHGDAMVKEGEAIKNKSWDMKVVCEFMSLGVDEIDDGAIEWVLLDEVLDGLAKEYWSSDCELKG